MGKYLVISFIIRIFATSKSFKRQKNRSCTHYQDGVLCQSERVVANETTRKKSNGNRVEQGKPLRGICLNEPDSAKCRIFIVKTFKRMKHYKLQTGGNRNIFNVLTIDDSGRMTLTFHGTDRTITHEATTNEDGWIAAGSSLYPPLSCGKWAESPAAAKGTREREKEGEKPATAKGARERENEGETPATAKGTRERENEGETPADAKRTRERENEGENPATKVAGTERRTGTERKKPATKEKPCGEAQGTVAKTERRKTATERNIYADLYGDYFQEAQQKEKENQKQMVIAGIATVVVFIILVHFIGIFGIAALGLIAGGIIKA